MSISAQLVYSKRYDIGLLGLEKLHPFDSRKYSRAFALLRRAFGSQLRKRVSSPTSAASASDLLAVHTADYLQQLKSATYLANALEVSLLQRLPSAVIDWCVLRHMRWATAGTLLATRLAMESGLAVNLSGGYHHAKPDRGEGFCIYSDIALAINMVRREKLISETDRIAYVDVDAHQGNGVCHAFFDDPRVFIFDIFNGRNYPIFDVTARRRVDCAVPLMPRTADAEYLQALESKLPPFLDSLTRGGKVGLAIYNAGTDVYTGDTLGGLSVSAEGILQRDQFALRQLIERGIPTVMLLSGGYSRDSYRMVAATVQWMLETWQ